jgi:rubrerythrin
MERDLIFLDTPEGFDLMLLDVEAEDRAIEQYEAHLAAIDHPKIRRIIERILVDEHTHRLMFKDYVKELGGDPNKKLSPPVSPWNQDDKIPVNLEADNSEDLPLVKLLNNRVRQEYITIMSYLHRSFISWNTNLDLSRCLIEDRAIWHMTHMGHVGEAVAGLGERPEMDLTPPPMTKPGISDRKFSRWGKENEAQLIENTLQLIQKLEKTSEGTEEEEELEGLERQLKRIEKHDRFIQQQFENDLTKQ